MVPARFEPRGKLQRARPKSGRSARHGAAEPLGGRNPALGMPARWGRHHADQLARQIRRTRLLPGGRRGKGAGLRGHLGRGRGGIQGGSVPAPCHARLRAKWRSALPTAGRSARSRGNTACRPRAVVGHALHVRDDGAAQGRAASPAHGTGSRRGARGAEPLWPRRTDARRDAPLPYDGRALAAGHGPGRRRVRLPAALRRGRRLRS